jgi:hypothetical protein
MCDSPIANFQRVKEQGIMAVAFLSRLGFGNVHVKLLSSILLLTMCVLGALMGSAVMDPLLSETDADASYTEHFVVSL